MAHSSNGVFKSTDAAQTWQQISNGLNSNQALSVNQLLAWGSSFYIATVDGIYKSSDMGESWQKKSNGITIGPGATYEFNVSLLEHDGNLFTGAWNGIYRSADGAENWEITNVSGFGICPGYFTIHNGVLFAARESINFPYGYFSTDSGENWEPLTSISAPVITFLSEPPTLWAGTIHGVWLSSDDGINWEHRSDGLSPDPYSSSIIRVNGILITSLKFGGSAVFSSANEGIFWENISDGLTFLNTIEKLIVYDNKIIAATSSGLWQRDISEIITGIAEQNTQLTASYKLDQNYPNPFNPSTKIKYSIPVVDANFASTTLVQLKVYDILGNEVATLVNEEQPAGSYEVEFQSSVGNRQMASGVSSKGGYTSGVYFYQLRLGSFSQTRKMIVIK
jgi:photosystem II stability/assembly factor-like uncharacterized protein